MDIKQVRHGLSDLLGAFTGDNPLVIELLTAMAATYRAQGEARGWQAGAEAMREATMDRCQRLATRLGDKMDGAPREHLIRFGVGRTHALNLKETIRALPLPKYPDDSTVALNGPGGGGEKSSDAAAADLMQLRAIDRTARWLFNHRDDPRGWEAMEAALFDPDRAVIESDAIGPAGPVPPPPLPRRRRAVRGGVGHG